MLLFSNNKKKTKLLPEHFMDLHRVLTPHQPTKLTFFLKKSSGQPATAAPGECAQGHLSLGCGWDSNAQPQPITGGFQQNT